VPDRKHSAKLFALGKSAVFGSEHLIIELIDFHITNIYFIYKVIGFICSKERTDSGPRSQNEASKQITIAFVLSMTIRACFDTFL